MRISPATALRLDAAGCFAGAAVLFASATVWNWTDLPSGWRFPVAVALLLFSGLLVVAAITKSRRMMALSILGNIGWILAGSYALMVSLQSHALTQHA